MGLDVGTSKITAIVGEMTDDGGLDIIGIGLADSRGIRRGVVVNLEAAVESIKKAIEEAELTGGRRDRLGPPRAVGRARQGLQQPRRRRRRREEPGDHARGRAARDRRREGGRAAERPRDPARPPAGLRRRRAGRDRRARRHDGRAARGERARRDRQRLVHPEHRRVREPGGRGGASTPCWSSWPRRSPSSRQDEKELGVALVDIGGGTTDFAIFERGSLWHTGVVAVGGDHFTNDIAVGLRTPIPDAEKIKRRCGCALSAMVDEDETMEVASVGGRKPRVMARRILSEILQPRAEEIFHLLWDEIRRAGLREIAELGYRAHRRRRDARGRGGDRRADFRPAGPARQPGRAWAGWPTT